MNVQFVDAGMASERLTHCCFGRPLGRAQLLAFAAIGVTFALPVQAQEPQKPITSTTSELALDEIVIEGDWLGESSEADAQFYPGARTILSGNDLHLTGNRNLEDALRKVPSVRIEDETGTGVLPNIGIRGLNPLRSERVMMLLDGIPLALAPYTGTGLSLFPATFETIERADIVRGGGAVHYGPNNVSGVIDLISKPISSEFSGTAKQRLIIDERTGNILSDSYLRFGGYVHPDLGLQAQINTVDGQAGRDHSETDVLNIMLDGEWRISDSASLKGRLQYYDVDAKLPGALTPKAYEEDPSQSQRPYDGFVASSNRASLVYNKRVGDSGEFKWINFAHKSDRSFQFAQPFDPAEEPTVVANSPRAFTVFGTEPRYTYSFNTGEVSHKVTIGARYLREEVDFVVDRTELANGNTETARDWYFETDAYAAYISDTMLLMNDRLEVTPGLRFEHVDTVFRNNLDDTTSRNKTTEALPGLAVSYAADNGVFLFGNANRSLRVPQVAQVTREGEVSNELAWNYELGMRYAPAAGINLGASLFRIDFSDQIEFDRPSLSFKNLGETRHQGIELTADWSPVSLPDLTVQANYTYTDTEQRSGDNIGNEVPFSSRHQVNLGLDYEVENWTFGINGSYRSAAFSDAANTGAETGDGSAGQLPSAWIWDLHASKVLDVPRQNIRLTGAINNVFDEEYYLRGVDVSPVGRVPHPGRSLSVALQVDF